MGAATLTTMQAGRYHVSERDLHMVNKFGVGNSNRACIYVHGAGVNADSGATGPTGRHCLSIAEQRPVFGGDFGGITTWGNQTARDRIEDMRVYAGSTYGSQVDQVHLFGISMGTISALNYANANPTRVKSIAGILCLPDLDDLYQSNPLGTVRGQIEAAYGITHPTPLPAGSNPAQYGSTNLAGIPMKFWYVTNDVFQSQATIEAGLTALGATGVSLGAVGHSDAAILATPVADVLEFFDSNDA